MALSKEMVRGDSAVVRRVAERPVWRRPGL